jgi:CysZ protein
MFFKDFTGSIKAYANAFELANKLGLWKYCLVPVIIGLVTGLLILAAAWFQADPIGEKISSAWPFEFGKETVASISFVLGIMLVLLFGTMLFKHAVMAISAPFMTPLSEKVEMYITGKELDKTDTAKEYVAALVRGTRINVRNLVMETLITFPLLILSLIPLLNIFTAILIMYAQSYYAGYGNMDYTLERYLNYKDTKTFVRKNRGIAVGNGFVFHLILMVPLAGMILALPLATIAATSATLIRLNEPAKG